MFLCGVLLLGGLLFGFAGTLHYPGAWLFMALLFIPMFLLGVGLMLRAPDLLEKRLRNKEMQGVQKGVIALCGLLFMAVFALCGLDHRFAWSHVPRGIVAFSSILQLVSYVLYAEVMRENAYISRVVEVQKGQKVVDTGLYGVVRHPMYAVTITLFLSMPLVLESYPAFLLMLLYPLLIILRIRGEEALLLRKLDGYADYTRRVRWRLIPFIW